jgi:hypothetical protein
MVIFNGHYPTDKGARSGVGLFLKMSYINHTVNGTRLSRLNTNTKRVNGNTGTVGFVLV